MDLGPISRTGSPCSRLLPAACGRCAGNRHVVGGVRADAPLVLAQGHVQDPVVGLFHAGRRGQHPKPVSDSPASPPAQDFAFNLLRLVKLHQTMARRSNRTRLWLWPASASGSC